MQELTTGLTFRGHPLMDQLRTFLQILNAKSDHQKKCHILRMKKKDMALTTVLGADGIAIYRTLGKYGKST